MTFEPDTPLVDRLHASPNSEPRRPGFSADMLLLHYTGLPSLSVALDVLSRPDYKVSSHYVVGDDGQIVQMVPERLRAWHAGVAVWGTTADINSCSIGIEIHNPGHDHGYPDFPEAQMRALARLSADICRRHRIRPERVLAHSDVAPLRKADPGEKLDWLRLHRAGVGNWVAPAPIEDGDAGLGVGDSGPVIRQAQGMLREYGYGIEASGSIDHTTQAVLRAFQRHFRPARTDGRLDRSTRTTLERLLAHRPLMVA